MPLAWSSHKIVLLQFLNPGKVLNLISKYNQVHCVKDCLTAWYIWVISEAPTSFASLAFTPNLSKRQPKAIALDSLLWPSEFSCCFTTTPLFPILKKVQLVFPTRVFPNLKPVFLAIFYYPKPGYFSTTKPGNLKKPGIAVAFKY